MKDYFLSRKNSMPALQMITFRKGVSCPSSQSILAFRKKEVEAQEYWFIERHLESCEFCAAESEFYGRFPQSEESVKAVRIPPHLYELAEALLNNHHRESSLLNRLINENEVTAIESV